MDDRRRIDLGNSQENSLFEFLFGFDADMAQERVSHLPEKRFHQVEPRTVFGRMHVLERVGLGPQIGARLLGNMSRMVETLFRIRPFRQSGLTKCMTKWPRFWLWGKLYLQYD